MNTNNRFTRGVNSVVGMIPSRRGFAWGMIIIAALLAFEMFNYSTTQFALTDVLGNLNFAGISWATILSIAFCGIDFAGIARLFTPEKGREEPAEVWYLFGAWLLAASMNASLTWWGVSVAIVEHSSKASGVVMTNAMLLRVVPIFVAVMVWLIRVLIIGAFSVAGERLFSQSDSKSGLRLTPQVLQPAANSSVNPRRPAPVPYTSAPKPTRPDPYPQPEPVYQNLSLSAKPAHNQNFTETPRRS
jgi:hypothetical protein